MKELVLVMMRVDEERAEEMMAAMVCRHTLIFRVLYCSESCDPQ